MTYQLTLVDDLNGNRKRLQDQVKAAQKILAMMRNLEKQGTTK